LRSGGLKARQKFRAVTIPTYKYQIRLAKKIDKLD
jgi:hypothetical protein